MQKGTRRIHAAGKFLLAPLALSLAGPETAWQVVSGLPGINGFWSMNFFSRFPSKRVWKNSTRLRTEATKRNEGESMQSRALSAQAHSPEFWIQHRSQLPPQSLEVVKTNI